MELWSGYIINFCVLHGNDVPTQINIVFLILVLISLFKFVRKRAAMSQVQNEKKGMSEQVKVVMYVLTYVSYIFCMKFYVTSGQRQHESS